MTKPTIKEIFDSSFTRSHTEQPYETKRVKALIRAAESVFQGYVSSRDYNISPILESRIILLRTEVESLKISHKTGE